MSNAATKLIKAGLDQFRQRNERGVCPSLVQAQSADERQARHWEPDATSSNRIESDDIRETVEAEFQEVDERRKGKGAQTDAPFGDTSRLTQTGIIRRGGGQR
jgi:hypothetical protein